MHHDYDSRPTLREQINTDLRGIAEILDTSADGLVLERLPNGEMAWLKPEHPTAYQLPPLFEEMLVEMLDSLPVRCGFGMSQAATLRCRADASTIIATGDEQIPCVVLLCDEHARPYRVSGAALLARAIPVADAAVFDSTARVTVTDAGRRALAMAWLFGTENAS